MKKPARGRWTDGLPLFWAVIVMVVLTGSAGCVTPAPEPTPDIPATVAASIREAMPTATPTPTPDLEALVQERLRAIVEARPDPTESTPAPTPTATSIPSPTPAPTRDLSDLVERVLPGVVRIETNLTTGSGAIFEIDRPGASAYILTNYHVIKNANGITVQVDDGVTYKASLLGIDQIRDLAVLRICCGYFQTLTLGNAESLRVGSEVIAVGYPLGLFGSATVTRGIVSATRYDSAKRRWLIQTDSAINAGNSGGPLFSATGEVIDINTVKIEQTSDERPTEGLGFAISQVTIQPQLASLKEGRFVLAATPTPRPVPTSTPVPTPFLPTSALESFSHQSGGYTVYYPADWLIDQADYPETLIYSPDGAASVFIYDFHREYSDLDEVATDVIQAWTATNNDIFELRSVDKLTLPGGLLAISLSYRWRLYPQYCIEQKTEIIVLARSGGYGLMGGVCENAPKEVQYRRQVAAIQDSFRLAGGYASPTPAPKPTQPTDYGSIPPHIVIGTAYANGIAAPAGSTVTAWSNGVALASATVRSGGDYGPLLIPRPGGATVYFTIGTLWTEQVLLWEQGGAEVLNLSASSFGQ